MLKQGEHIPKKSKDLEIGDLVKICKGDRVPADLAAIYSDGDQGTLFLKTDQLDGETDWKLRKSIKKTQQIVETSGVEELYNSDLTCEVK